MKINKHNYEEFFLLYTDNELNAEDRKAVEDFVAMHSGLKEELSALLQTRLPLEKSPFLFNKEMLFRSGTTSGAINAANYESYFLLYTDNELTGQEREWVENFIMAHPDKKTELDLLLRVKLQPDNEVVFTGKTVLYRREKPVVSIAIPWRKIVAAASIILTGALIWTNTGRIKKPSEPFVKATGISAADPAPEVKEVPAIKNVNTIAVQKNEHEPAESRNNTAAALQNTPAVNEKQQTYRNTIVEEAAKPVMEDDLRETENSIAKPAIKNTIPEPMLPVAINQVEAENKLPGTVKPVILDQAAFNGKEEEDIHKNELAFLDTDNTEKKSKGAFRGLFRKASRFVNRATNADDKEGKESIVRIASFEIVKK
ncbi:MAG: hypothetical protein KF862_25485 [Chitinophagaceae bacterium]|nr:hypothetical protein [Chitinophagaceae bacterium]